MAPDTRAFLSPADDLQAAAANGVVFAGKPMRAARQVLACLAVLAVAGCALNPRYGEHVYSLQPKSIVESRPALRAIERHDSGGIGQAHGVEVRCDGNETTSFSMNYSNGAIETIPPEIKLTTITVQNAPRLRFVLFNNGSTCTNFPDSLMRTMTHAVRATLSEANNPAPPGIVEIHFIPPEVKVHSLTSFRERKPRIHLKFYNRCSVTDELAKAFYLGASMIDTVHELSHAAYDWRGKKRQGNSERIATSSDMCMLEEMQGLDPQVYKGLTTLVTASVRAELQMPASAKIDIDKWCSQWNHDMRTLVQSDAGGTHTATHRPRATRGKGRP
ncbi:MAG TPA: hypothetical protein VFG73_04420 [Rhodanobacteraceae bacterium]|nr:hypothetical protein [Rhodanobacteraceae bacterium]